MNIYDIKKSFVSANNNCNNKSAISLVNRILTEGKQIVYI